MIRPRKRNRPVVPFIVAAIILALVAGGLVALLVRGGGDDEPAGPGTTPVASEFGRPPDLDGNVIEVYPPHGTAVKQDDTRAGNPDHPGAVCIRVHFGETNGTWYRLAVDAQEVTTTDTTWYGINPATQELPEEAQLCYAPPEGLRTGLIDASVIVQEPNGISPIREIVEWRFRVDP